MEPNNTDSLFGLQVDHESAAYFRQASQWVKFITIAGFIFFGLCALVLAFAGSAISAGIQKSYPMAAGGAGGLVVVILIAMMVAILLLIFLFRFATLTRRGIERHDQITFNEGLKSLRYYFIVSGVLAILGIIFSVLSNLTKMFA
jgi:hypothetical protein